MRTSILFLLLVVFASCNKKSELVLPSGDWRGVLLLQNQQLPFNFEVGSEEGKQIITIKNGTERLKLDSIIIKEDSLIIPMHLFDAEIRARLVGNELKGAFIKNYTKDYKLPFVATYGIKERFEKKHSEIPLPKKYKVHFSNKPDSVFAVAIFNPGKDRITGSILTTTGDDRYLEGITTNDSLFLSTFDGEHAYLYKAKINPNHSLSGIYFSGKSFNTTFTAVPDDSVELPNANNLTFLKPGFDKISFSFPGMDKKEISLDDAKYKNKVVLIQILGTWCPNCMDETRFLAPWFKENKDKGVEIIGLAYEKKDDFEYAKKRLKIMKERLGVEYDLAFAGSSAEETRSKTLPMLNKVLAFPTTIFIDKQGKVRKIHTGFSGPGTGKYYDDFIKDFNETIDGLVAE